MANASHSVLPPDDRLPVCFIEALSLWLNEGRAPSAFLLAVLSNDLIRSIQLGAPGSIQHLPALIDYCIANLPSVCWGNRTWVEYWRANHQKEI